MRYDPHRPERSHHLHHLVEAHRKGAEWHEIARIYLDAQAVKGVSTMTNLPLHEFELQVREQTGLSETDLLRMTLTLKRVEAIAAGWHVNNLLSSDLDAVETATRIAWNDPTMGRSALLDLKSGKVTPSGVRSMLDAVEGRTPARAADDHGPHGHWAGFDEGLEMLEMNRMHIILARGELVSDADFDRLVRLARGCGYGQADSFLTEFGSDGTDDTPEAAASRESFENYMDGEYWSYIDRSERLLGEARPNGGSRKNAGRICDAMRDAYERGRTQRVERPAAVPSPAP